MAIKFNTANSALVNEALDRYAGILAAVGIRGFDRLSARMDLCAADGENGNPSLDWHRLIAADDFNFAHDIGGIIRHMNRESGRITGCFLPRFARQSEHA